MKSHYFLLPLAFTFNVQAANLKPIEDFVNSFYDCGKITNTMTTQWTEHQTGTIVKCSNTKRYLILKAGPNRHSVRPILSDPFDPNEQAEYKRREEQMLRITDSQGALPSATNVNSRASTDCEKPEYPEKARRLNQEGTVQLKLLIDANGKVNKALIENSSGFPLLDEASLTNLSKCQFKAGRYATGWASIQYNWKLN